MEGRCRNLLNFLLYMEATAQNYVKNWIIRNPDRTSEDAWKVWNGLRPETQAFIMNLNGFNDRSVPVSKTC
jgi:hypothetical protein